MKTLKESEHFIYLFGEIYKNFHQTWDKTETRPTPETSAILLHLKQSGPLTLKEASLHFNRSKAAMTEIVQRMEAQGWIEKVTDEDDKRKKYFWLTKEGEALLDKASRPLDLQRLDKALRKVDQTHLKSLFKTLECMIKEKEKSL